MFESVYHFMTTVPVENSVLRGVIMLAEILALGVVLYWVWERVPWVVRRAGALLSRRRATAPEAKELEKVPFADMTAEHN